MTKTGGIETIVFVMKANSDRKLCGIETKWFYHETQTISISAFKARAEAEEFFMQRGARRATVEGGGDAERSGNRPFGTEQSLEVMSPDGKCHCTTVAV